MTANNSNGAAEWLTTGRFAAVLGLLIFTSFPGVLLGQTTFVVRDYGLFSYPVAFFQRESFWQGQLPMWDPYSCCGIPFLAQWNTMPLYPPALLYLLFPLTWSLPFFCLLHLFWGGLGMYHLAYRWTGHRLAAAIAGVIFSFNGLSLNFLMWPSHTATFSWLPWVLWLGQQALRGQRDRSADASSARAALDSPTHGTRGRGARAPMPWAILAGSMQMLAGGPESIMVTWGVLFSLAVGESFTASTKHPAPRSREAPTTEADGSSKLGPWSLELGACLLRFFSMAILVTLICSAQLFPFLQLVGLSQRDTSFGSSTWAMPLWGWANFLVPLFGATRTAQNLFQQQGQYWTSSYYAGIGTLLLAAIAIWRVRDWRVRLLAWVSIVSLVLALGDDGYLYRFLRSWVPLFGFFRYPVKFVVVVLALAPLLAAFGFKELASQGFKLQRFEWACAAVMLALIAAILFADQSWPLSEVCRQATFQNGLARAGFLGIIFFVFWLLRRLNPGGGSKPVTQDPKLKTRLPVLFACLVLLTFWLDFETHVPPLNLTVNPAVFDPGWARSLLNWNPEPRLGYSRAKLTPKAQEVLQYHVLSSPEQTYRINRLALHANCNLLDDIPQAHGFFSLVPWQINNAIAIMYLKTNSEFSALLDLMAVSQQNAPGPDPRAWKARPTAMPMITAGQEPVFVDDNTLFESVSQTNLDFRQLVFLPPEARGEVHAANQPAAKALNWQFSNQRVTIQAESPGPCLLVISQTYYPHWKASVDGVATRLWRADYAFQAVEMPAGRHQIVLAYQDNVFRTGAIVSIVGLMVWLGLWLGVSGLNRRAPR